MNIHIFVSQVVNFIKKHPLRAILILGFVHGLIYVFMIPVWWHHEEPGHFEYVWLAANQDKWPQKQEYNNDLRRQIAESMFASGQENLFNVSPHRLDEDPIYIGGSPVGRKPVYYWLVSLPLKLLRERPILMQLYTARLVSLGLFLLSLWLAWLFMGELAPKGHPLQWMLPFSLALLPGYLDNMTSVHDDVLGAVAAGLFLWLSIRIIKKGFSLLSLLGWVLSVALCFYSRDTTVPLVLLAPFVLLFRLLKEKTFPIIGTMFFLTGVFVSLRFFTLTDASQWFSYPTSDASVRQENTQAPFGDFSFALSRDIEHFGQSFDPGLIKTLRKKTYSLGVWIWADTPQEISLPIINYRTPTGLANSPEQKTNVGTEPAFYVINIVIPYEAGHAWLTPLPSYQESKGKIYYDGFVLTEGEYSAIPPSFDDDELLSGIWDGKPFVNMVRNPSAEHIWLGASKASYLLKLRWYIEPALYLQTIQDTQGFGWYYQISLSSLFTSFWGQGAGTEILLLGGFTYHLLKVISLIALAGVLLYLYQDPLRFTQPDMFFLLLVNIVVWLLTFFRGTFWILDTIPSVPYARYAFPVFIPTLLFFSAGFLKSFRWINQRYHISKHFPELAFQTLMLSLAGYAIFSFGGYFYPSINNLGFLVLLVAFTFTTFRILKSLDQSSSPEDKKP